MPAIRGERETTLVPYHHHPSAGVVGHVRWRHLPTSVTASHVSTLPPRSSMIHVHHCVVIYWYTCTCGCTYTCIHTYTHVRALGDEVKSLRQRHRPPTSPTSSRDGHHAEAYHPLDSPVNLPLRSHPLVVDRARLPPSAVQRSL